MRLAGWPVVVLLGAGSVLGACRPPAQETAPPAPVAQRKHSPALAMFMRSRMNPPFSRITFFMFHAEGQEASALLSAVEALAEATRQVAVWPDPPTVTEQAREVFFEYARQAEKDAAHLVEIVRSGDRDGMVRAFEDVQRRCDNCHHYFRND
jgi:hypothetical protein